MKRKKVLRFVAAVVIILCVCASVFVLQEVRYKKVVGDINYQKLVVEEELNELKSKPVEQILVFNKNLKAGQSIKEDDLMTVLIDKAIKPEAAINEKDKVIGKSIKIGASMYQPVTNEILYTNEAIPDDLRVKELNYVLVPEKLETGEYVDLRIKFPTGQDYIVLSKKQVTNFDRLFNESNTILKETVWLNIDEKEIVRLGSAVVDAFINKAELYLIQYVEPYIQKPAVVTYPENFPVLQMIKENPSLVNKAEMELELKKRETLESTLKEMFKDQSVNFEAPDMNSGAPATQTPQPQEQPNAEGNSNFN